MIDSKKILTEQEKKELADKISSQFDYVELTVSKNNGEIRSIKGVFEIRFPGTQKVTQGASR